MSKRLLYFECLILLVCVECLLVHDSISLGASVALDVICFSVGLQILLSAVFGKEDL